MRAARRMAYHRVMAMLAALPAEYMGGSRTHVTDYDPETSAYGSARYERRRGEAPPKEAADRWVAMFNSGASVLDIANKAGYPYLTVQNEIAKHPAKTRGGESTVLMTVHLTDDLAKRVEMAKGEEPTSRFVLKLLERGVVGGGYAKAAGVASSPTEAEADRWERMHGRGLSPAQIAEAVGRYPREVSLALRKRLGLAPTAPRGGVPRKLTVRMPVRLLNLLDAAARRARATRAKVMQALLGRELDLAGA